MATIAGLFFKGAVVILEETSDPQNRSFKANLLLKAFSFRANAVQAISKEVAVYLAETTRINLNKIRIVPNGVEIPGILSLEKRNELRETYSLKEGDFVVGFVGRLHNDHKRFTDLLEAIKLAENKAIKLLIVGDGKDIGLLNSEIQRLDLQNQVIHVGYQADPHPFYDLMDLLCIPSSREGFGLVAVEGMFHKLPIIASSVGGLRGVVEDGITGIRVKPFSPIEISSAILNFYSHPEFIRKYGESGYQRAVNLFSAQSYVQIIQKMYLELLSNSGHPFLNRPKTEREIDITQR